MTVDLGALFLQALWNTFVQLAHAAWRAALTHPWLFLVAPVLLLWPVLGGGRRPLDSARYPPQTVSRQRFELARLSMLKATHRGMSGHH